MGTTRSANYIVFSDGSYRDGKYHGHSAYASYVLDLKTREWSAEADRLMDRKINYCEAYAIYRGIRQAVDMGAKRNQIILIVTDSMLSIDCLTMYHLGWDKSDPNIWRNSLGEEVSNWRIYKKILDLIDRKGLDVRYCHIKSHQDLDEAKKVLKKMGRCGVVMDVSTAKMCIEMNGVVDDQAASLTKEAKERDNNEGEGDYYVLVRKKPFKYKRDENGRVIFDKNHKRNYNRNRNQRKR